LQQYLYKLRRGSQEVALTPGTWVVGRTPNAGVYVPDPMVSRRHALIRVARNHLDVLDLGSRNGTYLNGQLVRGARGLFPGDRLKFGSLEYEVEGHPVAADDPYYNDDQETPLPTRLIRDEIADRAKKAVNLDDELGERTVVGRAPGGPGVIKSGGGRVLPPEPPTGELRTPLPVRGRTPSGEFPKASGGGGNAGAGTSSGGGSSATETPPRSPSGAHLAVSAPGGASPGGTPTLSPIPPPATPTPSPVPAAAPRVVLALTDATWAEQIQRAAAIHQNLLVERVGPTDALAAAQRAGPGLLLLDLDAAAAEAPAIIHAWKEGPDARNRAVLVTAAIGDAQGLVEARNLGAQAFVRAGKAAILVVAQIRFHIQLSGMLGD
jgi:hypothetical protein